MRRFGAGMSGALWWGRGVWTTIRILIVSTNNYVRVIVVSWPGCESYPPCRMKDANASGTGVVDANRASGMASGMARTT